MKANINQTNVVIQDGSKRLRRALEAVEIYTELQKIFIEQNIINIECRV